MSSTTAARGRDVLTALGLAAGPAAALGLGRFAYALLLPSMQAALGWSFATAAAMNTANSAGYLLGALGAAPLARYLGARRVFLGGIVLTALFLLGSAAVSGVVPLLLFRLLAGASGAATFIVGGTLAAQLAHAARPGRAALLLGTYFAGGGIGIAVSGVALPALIVQGGTADGWRYGWVALAAGSVIAAVLAALAVRHTGAPAPGRRAAGTRARVPGAILAAYTAFGAGYIAYMTFVVAYLKGGGAGTVEITGFWATLGLAAVAGGFFWGPVLGRLQGGRGPAVLIAAVAVGAALPLLSRSAPLAFASAAIFGGSFLAVVTSVTNLVRQTLPPAQWTAAIAILTTGFALGQCAGPLLSGVLADQANGLRAGLGLSVLILVAGVGVSLLARQKPGMSAAGP